MSDSVNWDRVHKVLGTHKHVTTMHIVTHSLEWFADHDYRVSIERHHPIHGKGGLYCITLHKFVFGDDKGESYVLVGYRNCDELYIGLAQLIESIGWNGEHEGSPRVDTLERRIETLERRVSTAEGLLNNMIPKRTDL